MKKRDIVIIILAVIVSAFLCGTGKANTEATVLAYNQLQLIVEENQKMKENKMSVNLPFCFFTKDNKLFLNQTDMDILYRVAVAEAGNKEPVSIKNVVTVILNRICNPNFQYDISVETTVFRYRQFSCVQDGNYARSVNSVNKLVKKAVNEAVANYEYGNDSVNGATHYCNLSICNPDWQYTMKKLDVKDPVGHSFFK